MQQLLEDTLRAELTAVVRIAQQNPDFHLADWSAAPLATQGMSHPGGLVAFRGSGYAAGERRTWSVVLKQLREPAYASDQRDIWYWKRELLAAQAGLIAQPGPVGTPRIYAHVDAGTEARVWLELLADESPARWEPAEYCFAAREIGRMNGAQLALGQAADRPWLVEEHCRWWLQSVRQPGDIWANPWVMQAFGPLRGRIADLEREQAALLATLRHLPQIVSHFDLHRRNLFIRRGQLVAIDWGFLGRGALGGDLYGLLGSSALLGQIEPLAFAGVEADAFAAYIGGLADAGWRGDPRLIRLAYTAWSALWMGAAIAHCAATWTRDPTGETARRQFGWDNAELAQTWAALCAHALDHADEARRLRAQLRRKAVLASAACV